MNEFDLLRKCLGSTEVTSHEVLDAFKSLSTDLEALPAKIQPTPEAKRSKKRSPEERGLPRWKELKSLARTYLRLQHRHWPDLVKAGVVPPITEASILTMAKSFRKRFIKGRTRRFEYDLKRIPWVELGGSYIRYSCDNSNPRSLDQQLTLQLDRAHADKVFIPWNYVFADAAVTGTTKYRRGYKAAKRAMKDIDSFELLLINEIVRASRDTVEALRLGRFVKRLKKRLRGISDGFDSASPYGELLLTIYAAVQQWFIEQLKAKVNRGMNDAFNEMTNLGLPAIGYGLAPVVDENGRPVLGKDGEQKNALVKEGAAARWVLLAFVLYGIHEWSRDAIAILFNKYRVGGRYWDGTRIRLVLKRWKYVGIMTYHMTYHYIAESGKDKGKRKTKRRPRNEWRARKARHLQIIPRFLWKLVQKRLAKSEQIYAKKREERQGNRTELVHRELIRPYCECGTPMCKGHSGKYPSWVCLHGKVGKKGCQNKTYKSVRQFDKCILQFVGDDIFTEEHLRTLFSKANEYLKQEARTAAEFSAEVAELEAEIRSVIRKRDRILDVIDNDADEKKTKADTDRILDVIDNDADEKKTKADTGAATRLAAHEKRLKELRANLAKAKQRRPVPVEPLTVENINEYVKELRALLSQDVQAVAPILRDLLGVVTVKQVMETGKKKPTWEAHFTYNLVPVVLQISHQRNCPNTSALEYLKTGNWTMLLNGTIRIGRPGKFEQLCVQAADLLGKNSKISINTIASALGCTWPTAKEVMAYVKEGKHPVWSKPGKRNGKGSPRITYLDIIDDVVRLKDIEHRPFSEIPVWLKKHRKLDVSEACVRRAWDAAHRDEVKQAAAEGVQPVKRKTYHRLPTEVFIQIRKLAGTYDAETIARMVGCSGNTVRRELKRLGAVA